MQGIKVAQSRSTELDDLPRVTPSIWLFWPLWVLANAAGGAIGAAISGLIAMWQPMCSFILGPAVYIWIPLGLAQGFVLSLYLGRITRPWMIASTIGGFFGVVMALQVGGLLLVMSVSGEVAMAIAAMIGGFAIGYCQALILEGKVWSPVWWLAVSSITWATVIFVEEAFEWHGVTSALVAQANPLGAAVTIGLQGILSGIAMMGMLAENRGLHKHKSTIIELPEHLDDGTSLALKQAE